MIVVSWAWRWVVEVVYEYDVGRRQIWRTSVDTATDVRALVARAWASPTVLSWRVIRHADLDRGKRPASCAGCGEVLEPEQTRHGATGLGHHVDEVACAACPGHLRIPCPGCGRITVWPAATVGCGPPRG